MSKTPSIIPSYMQDIDPEVRAAKERELERAIQRTERNPEDRLQYEYTGTPQKTAKELETARIIQANMETKFRANAISKKIDVLLDQRRDLALVEQFEKLYAKVTS